jgi:hypothetical protein
VIVTLSFRIQNVWLIRQSLCKVVGVVHPESFLSPPAFAFHNNGVLQLKLMFSMRSNKKVTLSELHFDRTGLIRLIFLSARHDCANKTAFVMIGQLN